MITKPKTIIINLSSYTFTNDNLSITSCCEYYIVISGIV
ncbi:Uncharacterised protein [Citrobacter werkmanii]|uniref:Uncharacterized protein n=1 Tax=Citrobacter werkmanii TaxID=67827 RepID=A0A9N8CZ28_9ENTR|nr:Uncharacterised protein [Citrobacter werkmanii]